MQKTAKPYSQAIPMGKVTSLGVNHPKMSKVSVEKCKYSGGMRKPIAKSK